MADYHALIAQAVAALDQNTGKARRALYERARATQVKQLRAILPPLSESVIAKERLSLENTIRKVETEAARKSGTMLREPRPGIASPRHDAGRADSELSEQVRPRNSRAPFAETEVSRPAPPLVGRLPRWLTGKRARGSGDVVNEVHGIGTMAKAAQATRNAGEGRTPSQACPPQDGDASPSVGNFELGADANDLSTAHDQAREPSGRDRSPDLGEDQEALHPERHLPHATEDKDLQPWPPHSYRKLVGLVVTLFVLAGLAVTISWQWPHFSELYHYVAQIGAKQQLSQTAPQTASKSKFLGRVPQEQNTAGAPDSQASPTVAQRVVLYEEDLSDPQGKRYYGFVTWRTENVSPGPTPVSELTVRADVKIPERQMTMTWSLRRIIDHALPASHTVQIMFNLPADFRGGGVASVPGIMMKQSEQMPGTPLAKLAVEATNGLFIIELSAADADVQRNVQLLKESPWLDIPIIYNSGSRAILAMEKGPPGNRAFTEAFAAWEKK